MRFDVWRPSIRRSLRQLLAFLYRRSVFSCRYGWSNFALTSRYVIQAAAICYIGVAYANDHEAFSLFLGIVLWGFLNTILTETGNVIEQEHFEGTLENTLTLPCSRVIYLAALSIGGVAKAIFEATICIGIIALITSVTVPQLNVGTSIALISISTLCFMSLGIVIGAIALISKMGNRFVNLLQGPLLLLSGVYFPIETLPKWLQVISPFSPATHIFDVARTIIQGDSAIATSLVIKKLVLLGIIATVSIPLSCLLFNAVEHMAKKGGLLQQHG